MSMQSLTKMADRIEICNIILSANGALSNPDYEINLFVVIIINPDGI